VKVGTKVLSTEDNKLDISVLESLVQQIVSLRETGVEVVLVSSGAMGAGRGILKLGKQEKSTDKQVLSAVGQVHLMTAYAKAFKKYGQICAQVLATKEDFRDKNHYFNMRTCFESLLSRKVVPVVNENDVVSTTELLFTDNDELAGLVASQVGADAVFILSSIEGFMTGDSSDADAEVIAEIDCKDATAYQKYIRPDKTKFGRGGMLTKFNIAKKLTTQGITVHLTDGRRKNVLLDLAEGKNIGTKFLASKKTSAIKRRVAYSDGLTKGSVFVNKGAEELLVSKTKIMSLLPVGVVKVEGDFVKGDIVEIIGESKQKLGFGVAEYGSSKVKEVLGKKNTRAVIHYNHMFIDS